MRFNRHIDSDLRGFTRETSSYRKLIDLSAQNCHHLIDDITIELATKIDDKDDVTIEMATSNKQSKIAVTFELRNC